MNVLASIRAESSSRHQDGGRLDHQEGRIGRNRPALFAHLIHNELDCFLNSLQSLLSGFSPRVGSFQRRAVGGKSYAAVFEPVFFNYDFEYVAFHVLKRAQGIRCALTYSNLYNGIPCAGGGGSSRTAVSPPAATGCGCS
jgi:hypothetical protein